MKTTAEYDSMHYKLWRLEEQMFEDMKICAQVLGISQTQFIQDAIDAYIITRVQEIKFRERLEARIEKDSRILERLRLA